MKNTFNIIKQGQVVHETASQVNYSCNDLKGERGERKTEKERHGERHRERQRKGLKKRRIYGRFEQATPA